MNTAHNGTSITKPAGEGIRSFLLISSGLLCFGFLARGVMSLVEHKFGLGIALILVSYVLSIPWRKHRIVILLLGDILVMVSAGQSILFSHHKMILLAVIVITGTILVLIAKYLAWKSFSAE
jgi:hypothetical protein